MTEIKPTQFPDFSHKKLIAFDLDGTLAESRQPLLPDMAALITRLAAKVKVAIISGGAMEQFRKQFLSAWDTEIAHAMPASSQVFFSNIILMPTSGSQRYEYDVAKNEWMLTDKEDFPAEYKQKVLDAIAEIISEKDEYELPDEKFGEYVEERGTQITFAGLGQLAPLDKKKLWDPEQKKRKKIKARLDQLVPEVEIAIGGTTSIDFLPHGFNKGQGLKRLLQKLELTIPDMVFVGDALFEGGNDHAALMIGSDTVPVAGPKDTAEFIEHFLIQVNS